MRAGFPTLPFVLLTNEGSEQIASLATAADVTEYLIPSTGKFLPGSLDYRIVDDDVAIL